MKQTVSQNDFAAAFQACRPDNFSAAGLAALFDYLEEYESSTGEEMELDVIAICCDFSEYETAVEAAEQYSYTFDGMDEDEAEAEALEHLRNQTTVIEFDGGVIIQDF